VSGISCDKCPIKIGSMACPGPGACKMWEPIVWKEVPVLMPHCPVCGSKLELYPLTSSYYICSCGYSYHNKE
jgi:hypothetical protein